MRTTVRWFSIAALTVLFVFSGSLAAQDIQRGYKNYQDIINKYQSVGLKICELPDEPYDQILAMILLLKLNSIAEDRVKITDLVISSSLSEGVRFNIVSEVAESAFSGRHWWNSPCIAMTSSDYEIGDPSKVIKLFTDDWVSFGLSWRDMAKN